MALRASDLFHKNDVELNVLSISSIAMAKYLLLDMKLLTADFTKGKDIIVVNKTNC
jgi:3-hydroxyacyl-CoA dehydrogenase